MKTDQAIEILQSVDLDGYSRSPGFIGYFSASGKAEWTTAIDATERCVAFIGSELATASVITSAHVDLSAVANEGKTPDSVRLIVERLVKRSLIPVVDYSRFGTDYGSEHYLACLAAERQRFKVLALDQFRGPDLADFCATKMMVFGVFGHCFLFLKLKGLLLYPHDDIGFGIVATSPSADRKFGHELLEFAASHVPFYFEHSRYKMR